MFEKPLVLFGSPRGGTSLVAGCFANHGFWTGKTFGGPDGVGSGGYVNYENAAIKKFCKDHWPLDAGNMMKDPGRANLHSFCKNAVPPDTRWMFKGPTEYYSLFAHWFPNMVPVFIFRNEKQAVEAMVRRRGEKVRAATQTIVRKRYALQEEILNTTNAFAVEADKIVEGDYHQVEWVLRAYGIDLDPEACGKHLDPSRWHV